MKITETSSILKYLIGARVIGIGTTAICFLLHNNRVLKLYYNSHNKRYLFNRYDMISHLQTLNSISNDTYIGPDELLTIENNLVAYLYPYVKAKTLHHARKFLTLNEISEKYPKMQNDTKEISQYNFLLNDLHDRNILIRSAFYIIDLDRGYVDSTLTVDKTYQINMGTINKNIINSIFDVKPDEILEFEDLNIHNLYKESISPSPEAIYELLQNLNEQCQPYKSTAPTLRKTIKHRKRINSYYRYY